MDTIKEVAGCAWMLLLFILVLVGCATVFVWLMWLILGMIL